MCRQVQILVAVFPILRKTESSLMKLPSSVSVWIFLSIIARLQLSKHVAMAVNTYATIDTFLDKSFFLSIARVKSKMG
jgi:hypothetical protein